uniref:Uncharacterized protein n=1 Tax=Rousettus aegyptiacus TaxID=9407 RepID=A0A7J8BS23_ROUAE|nr:hypothetical protein HJG63_009609 [Rousettus aegyptiacus]
MTPKRQGGSPQHRLHPNQKNVCVGTRPHKDVLASAPTREANAADISDATSRLCPCVFPRGALPWSAMAGNTRTSPGRGPSALPCGCRLGHTSCEGRPSRCHSTPQSWAGSLQKRLRGLARILQAHLLEPPIASIAPGLKWETNSTLWCPVADHTVKQSHCNNF